MCMWLFSLLCKVYRNIDFYLFAHLLYIAYLHKRSGVKICFIVLLFLYKLICSINSQAIKATKSSIVPGQWSSQVLCLELNTQALRAPSFYKHNCTWWVTSKSSQGRYDVGVSTAIFTFPLWDPAVVILHGMLHRLFMYDFGNATIGPMWWWNNLFVTKKLITLFIYKNILLPHGHFIY